MDKDNATVQRLLEEGKKEFLAVGYEKASLRRICSNAGVTTGALYFFFENKESLFESIVSCKAERLMELVRRQTDSEVNGIGDSTEYQRELNEYLCSNKDVVRILLDKSEGTAYEGFREEYCSEIAKGFFAFYDKMGGAKEYRDIMRLIVRMRIQGYIEMLEGDYDMDKMMKFSALMETYGDCGFEGMMKSFDGIIKGSV